MSRGGIGMDHILYPALFHPCGDGAFSISFPDIPGCVSVGSSLADAILTAERDLREWGERCITKDHPLPLASHIEDIKPVDGDFVNFILATERTPAQTRPSSIDDIRRRLAPVFEKHGVRHAVLFGSYARCEADGMSDVDIAVDSGYKGLKFFGLLDDVIASLGGARVDLVEAASIAPGSRLEREIRADGVVIYEA